MLGIHLTLLIGPAVPLPAPPTLAQALQRVEVTHSDEGRSGFQLTFQAGRVGLAGTLDYPLLAGPLLRPFSRVILIVTFNATPRVLFDGVITNQQLSPGDQPGAGTLTVTGEDVSLMMDLEEQSAEHPAQSEPMIAARLIASYARYGLVPLIVPPPALDVPLPIERVPVQDATDLAFLQALAARYGYVFYVSPGPAPMANTAYWGPPKRLGLPQPALTVNMGQASNVSGLSFQHDALKAEFVEGSIQDRRTNQQLPVKTFAVTRPPLASQPTWLVHQQQLRRTRYRDAGRGASEAYAQAQGRTDARSDTVSADGELDAVRYGGILQARGLVGLRGAGYNYDGLYYVRRVTHSISRDAYTQRFSLAREGTGATLPLVRP